MKFRLYIDEVGNSDLRASADPNHRYLSLTGLVFELEYVAQEVFPAIESLKARFFHSHPDDPIILHRKELVNKRPPFEQLRDPGIERRFNTELLVLLDRLDYVVFTVTIDKLEHTQKYQRWQFDPYHYCLTVLVERYVMWLHKKQAVGDVLAESRGGKEDRRLKRSFRAVYDNGSQYLAPEVFSQRLTSKELKVKPKKINIAGLQIADLLAHPCFKAALARRNKQPLPTTFGGKIADIVQAKKYDRSPSGKIEGWGRKWLP